MDKSFEKLIFDSHFNSGFMMPSLKVDMPLYRYRSNIEYAIDEIKTGNIYLADLDELNDPFEATGMINRNEVQKIEYPISTFWVRSFFLHSWQWSSDVRNALENQWDSVVSLQKFAELVSTLAERCNAHYPIDAIVINYYNFCGSLSYQKRCYGNVACFSERNDLLSMWAYYANSHKGVCFKYDFTLLELDKLENKNTQSEKKEWSIRKFTSSNFV